MKAATLLQDLSQPAFGHHLVKKLIALSLDGTDRARELASSLLSSIYATVRDSATSIRMHTRLLLAFSFPKIWPDQVVPCYKLCLLSAMRQLRTDFSRAHDFRMTAMKYCR